MNYLVWQNRLLIFLPQGRQIEVHYDGWPEEMNHWRDDDDPALHPCGWAAKTGHPLMAPLTPQVFMLSLPTVPILAQSELTDNFFGPAVQPSM